jgi:hypothetical protein
MTFLALRLQGDRKQNLSESSIMILYHLPS